ncbi:MAG: DUF4160 domain-containing protein [Elusimicrobiota bacterium]|jgi:hypothetical protein
MPTVFREKGFRFVFYSNEGFEPCHIHVIGHGGEAKIWIPTCQLVWSYNLKAQELALILSIIRRRLQLIEEAWHAHFSR